MKTRLPELLISVVAAGSVFTGCRSVEKAPIESFPVSDIRLTESIFKTQQDVDLQYILQLDADRLLAPYRKEAGLDPKAENYTNWENTGLDGHIGGHYLSALSYMYAATGNPEIKRRLDYFIAELKECQDAAGDGYLSGVPGGRAIWKEIASGDIRAGGFSLNDRWVPLYNIHKIFAGLRDAWIQTGNETAKEMLIALTDWMANLTSGLSDEQIQEMLVSEHGGLNEVFADVADITGDHRYIELARRFSHKEILNPLLNRTDELTGRHANTQIPKVIGFERIAEVDCDTAWAGASRYFWDIVVNNRSVSIGGNSVREHFHPSDDFSSMLKSEQGPETCNTYNMLRLTKMLYESEPDSRLADYYERALYNHILSTQNPDHGGFVYFTPMRPGHYRVYSQPQTSFWCCVGSGLENHARYGEMIYSHRGDKELYVNLFIPSVLTWGDVTVAQFTSFPAEEGTAISISTPEPRKFSLNLRIPSWTDEQSVGISVNNETQKVKIENGFAVLKREWHDGDSIYLSLPMHLEAVQLPDGSSNYSFMYGPVVLAANLGHSDEPGLYADDSRGGHIADGKRLPLQNMPVILCDSTSSIVNNVEKVDGELLSFVLRGVSPESYDGITLTPFYGMHECRYIIYWEVLTPEQLAERRQIQAQEEQQRAALDAMTVDLVICGEQQPESDHFIIMSHSWTGTDDDNNHWRRANNEGGFGYTLKTGGHNNLKARISFDNQAGGKATVTADDTLLGVIECGQDGVGNFAEFDIPAGVLSTGKINLKITAAESSETPKIFEVRLVNP